MPAEPRPTPPAPPPPHGGAPARRAHDRFLVPLLDAPAGHTVYTPALLRWSLVGGALGALVAGLAGWAVATGALLVAALAPWAAPGAAAATFAAAGVGLAAGGLAGGLAALARTAPPACHGQEEDRRSAGGELPDPAAGGA